MAEPAPTEPTPETAPEGQGPAPPGGVEPLWRSEKPAPVPDAVGTSSPRRKVFLWLIGFLFTCTAVVGVLTWLRPDPRPYFAPVWLSDYQYRPFLTPPFSKQDQAALIAGEYFAKGRIQLKSLGTCLPTDTVVLYLSALAVTDEHGRVMLLPVDSDPASPQAFRSLKSVLEIVRKSPARKKLLVLEIGWPVEDPYWGRLDVGTAAAIPGELQDVPDPGRLVLCACAPGQFPLGSVALNRSVFSYFLEDGLRGWADFDQINPEKHGLITAKKLAAYTQTKVEEWAKLHNDTQQTPILYGEADDFPLVALARGKQPHLERAAPTTYPDWLVAAWKTREQWWTQERYRAAPWVFRQAEAAILHADRSWQYGADGAALERDLQAELGRLDKYYQAITAAAKPQPLSVAQVFQSGQSLDPKWGAGVKEVFRKVAEARASAAKAEDGDKAAAKIVEEFVEKNKQVSDAEWTGAVVEVLASDPFPRRETVQLGNRLLVLRQAPSSYAEAAAVHRLATLAEALDESSWPAVLMRKALLLAQRSEQVKARPRSFPWLAAALESAAQKRHDAEMLLFAHGYVPLTAAEGPIADALRDYEGLAGRQEVLEDALHHLHEALAFLPNYSAYLDFTPPSDPLWHDTAQSAEALQVLLKPPPAGLATAELNTFIESVRTRSESLRASMRQLQQVHAPEEVEALLARSKRPDANAAVLRTLSAQWVLPFHAPALRAKLWEARTALAARLADKILDAETEFHEALARNGAELLRDLEQARSLAAARTARSLALLRLAGLADADLEPFDKKRAVFVAVKAIDFAKTKDEIRDGNELSFSIRQAWAQVLPQQIGAEKEPTAIERASRVAPGWLRLGAKEELLARSASIVEQSSERALLSWLADRYRYASQEPDTGPFVARAAFALRDYAPKQDDGLVLPRQATVAELTPEKPAQVVRIPVQWHSLPKENRKTTFELFDPNEDWLQITADPLPLEKLTLLPADRPDAIFLSMQIDLRPQAELSASPRPAGFLFGLHFHGRTYYHKVALPFLPKTEGLEIVVSGDPKEPGIPLGDLRLRPSKQRQSIYLYVNNRGDKPRNLIVEVSANDRILTAGKVEVKAPAKQATRVVLGTPGGPEPSPKTTTAKEELPELTSPLQIRVRDKDRSQEVVATRELRVEVAHPREYVRVPAIRYEPPSEANQQKNRLDVTVQAVRPLAGPPCPVELVIPIDRIRGLKAVRTGTFRGDLPPGGEPLKLSAGEFEFEPWADDTGVVYLTVDGIERAFLFRTTFAPIGEPTTPREELRPGLRLVTGKYYRTGTKFEATVETDNAPAVARLLVSLGHWRNEAFETEIRHPFLTPRQKRIGAAVRRENGGIELDALLRDWRVPFDAVPIRGRRVVQARLLDPEGRDIVPPAYQDVLFDDHHPERVDFVNLPKQAKRDVPYYLRATGVDKGTGLRDVTFFFAHPAADGTLPPAAVKFDAKPSPTEPDVWAAFVYWPADRKGPLDVSVRFTNNLGLSTFAKGTVELVDFDPQKSRLGKIEGLVVAGPLAQPGVKVVLSDPKGNKLAELKSKDGGVFEFVNLPAGRYIVTATKTTSGRPLRSKKQVDLNPGQTVRLKLELFL